MASVFADSGVEDVVDDLDRIRRRAARGIRRRFLVIVIMSAVISSLLLLAAGSVHGRTVNNRLHFGSFDLGMTAADSVAVTVGLMLLATTINIALATLAAPDTGSEQISADLWRGSLNGVTFAAAILAIVIGETQFGVKDLSERWATSATCLLIGVLTGVIAAAGSWRATYDSVRDLAMLRLDRRIQTLRAGLAELRRATPMGTTSRKLSILAFVVQTLWLSMLSTTILIVGAAVVHQRFPWQVELSLIAASAVVVTPLQLVLAWSQTYRLTRSMTGLGFLRFAFVLYGSFPVAIALAALIGDAGRNYSPLLTAYGCCLPILPLAAWALRRRLWPFFGCLDEIGVRSLHSDLEYCLARRRQLTEQIENEDVSMALMSDSA